MCMRWKYCWLVCKCEVNKRQGDTFVKQYYILPKNMLPWQQLQQNLKTHFTSTHTHTFMLQGLWYLRGYTKSGREGRGRCSMCTGLCAGHVCACTQTQHDKRSKHVQYKTYQCTCTHARTHTHAHMHARTHTHTHTHAPTPTHTTHTWSSVHCQDGHPSQTSCSRSWWLPCPLVGAWSMAWALSCQTPLYMYIREFTTIYYTYKLK